MDLNKFSESLNAKINSPLRKAGFDIGGVSVVPKINITGSGGIYENPVDSPEIDADIINSNIGASGKVGFDALTKSGYNFGAGLSGNYSKGLLEFPEELQKFGALPVQKYGTRGIDLNRIDAYLNAPSGLNLRGSYEPKTEDYSVRAGIKVPF